MPSLCLYIEVPPPSYTILNVKQINQEGKARTTKHYEFPVFHPKNII
jgi:hypothetical protein